MQAELEAHFSGKSQLVRAIFNRLHSAAGKFGPLGVEPKQTSIHLVSKAAFAGIYTRKSYINLEFQAAAEIKDARIRKMDQVSKNRFHHTVRLDSVEDVDAQLLGWLQAAYKLKA